MTHCRARAVKEAELQEKGREEVLREKDEARKKRAEVEAAAGKELGWRKEALEFRVRTDSAPTLT